MGMVKTAKTLPTSNYQGVMAYEAMVMNHEVSTSQGCIGPRS
jgi:hypothetical protein